MLSWITNTGLSDTTMLPGQEAPASAPNPLDSIFMMVVLDTMAFLDAYSRCLDDMMTAAEDEVLLRRFNKGWIRILSRGQAELPALRESIQGFVRPSSPAQPSPTPSEVILHLSAQATQKLDSIVGKTRSTYDFLRAEFTALESRKQVSESESVTRLTELAFIFIPLSFMASVFSMQIQELQDPVPLRAFVAASICVLAGAYAFRLFIRSAVYTSMASAVSHTVRRQAFIAEGQPIPTRAALTAAVALVAYPILSQWCIVVTHLGSVVWLWASRPRLDTAFKLVVTVFVVIVVSVLPMLAKIRPWVTIAAKKGLLNFVLPSRLRVSPATSIRTGETPSIGSTWSARSN